MKTAVCLSNVPDTTTKVRFVNGNAKLDTSGIQWVINPWDELSLTRALELKETPGGAFESVSVITIGEKETEPVIRKALAMGADTAYRVNVNPQDAYVTAFQLAGVCKNENFDVIICGIDSSDYNGSMVGEMLAELLNIHSVSAVTSLEFIDNEFLLKRETDGGYEMLAISAPFVAIVQKGIALEPRIPSMRGIMAARTKPLLVSEPIDCPMNTAVVSFELPGAKKACKMIDPDNLQELVHLLHSEAKVI